MRTREELRDLRREYPHLADKCLQDVGGAFCSLPPDHTTSPDAPTLYHVAFISHNPSLGTIAVVREAHDGLEVVAR